MFQSSAQNNMPASSQQPIDYFSNSFMTSFDGDNEEFTPNNILHSSESLSSNIEYDTILPNHSLEDGQQQGTLDIDYSTIPQNSAFSRKDDFTLLEAVRVHGKDWKKICRMFKRKNLTVEKLKKRFDQLRSKRFGPKVKFTHKEDLILARCHTLYGTRWADMIQHFDKRDALMLKNRFYSHVKSYLNEYLAEFEASDIQLEEIIQPKLIASNCPPNIVNYLKTENNSEVSNNPRYQTTNGIVLLENQSKEYLVSYIQILETTIKMMQAQQFS